jgi:UPF0042 nucleotide-binding protein
LNKPVTVPKIIILTGLSGSGKSTALAALEDAGFYCVDNMPVVLLPRFMELPITQSSHAAGLAFGMDLRERDFLANYSTVINEVKQKGFSLETIFLEADEEIILQRYSQTRRHHPVTQENSLMESIRFEKTLMEGLKKTADQVINTSRFNVHELKRTINSIARQINKLPSMRIHIVSFGFKYGTPSDADLIIDVRFLPNPYFVPELKEKNGETAAVKSFVLQNDITREFLHKYIDLLDYLIPLFEDEGKAYLTIAVGCTGGRHRSVAIARTIYEHIHKAGKNIAITHRDIRQD